MRSERREIRRRKERHCLFGKVLLVIVAIAMLYVFTPPSLAAPTVSVEPSYTNVLPGDIFSVNVSVYPDGNEVGSAQYTLYFDSTLLTALEQVQGPFLSQDGVSTNVIKNTINNTIGKTEYGEYRVGDPDVIGGVTTPGVLATVTFKAVEPGTSSLDLSNVLVSTPYGYPISVLINDGVVEITGTHFNISLVQGWNQISVPFNITSWALGEETVVVNPLNVTPTNSLASIYRYNTTSSVFEKCDYFDDWGWAPATGSESFTELEPGRGYWVMAKNDCDLTFTGTEAYDIDVTLATDWNLIGWYSLEEALLGEEAVAGNPLNVTPANSLTSIYRYNSSTELFEKCDHFDDWGWSPATGSGGFTGLEPGRGYWVMAENGCVWRHRV